MRMKYKTIFIFVELLSRCKRFWVVSVIVEDEMYVLVLVKRMMCELDDVLLGNEIVEVKNF